MSMAQNPSKKTTEEPGNQSGQGDEETKQRSLSETVVTASGSVMGGVLLGEAFFGPAGAVVGGLIGAGAALAISKRDKN